MSRQDSVAMPAAAVPAATPAAAGRRRAGSLLARYGPPALVFVIAIGAWVALHYGLPEEKAITVPLPWDVVEIAFLDSINFAYILDGLWLSAKSALVGLAVTVVVGLAFAIAMSQAKWVEHALLPYAVAMQTTPILALVPLIGVVLGYDFASRVLVVVLISVFPFINNALFGLLSAERSQHDLLTLHDAGRMTRLLKLQLPAALPAIFSGLRVAAVMAVVGAVVGDFFFTQGEPGLGQLINLDASQLQYERMYGAVILAMALGIVVYLATAALERRVIGKWHTETRPGG